jgi:S-formylglutathione hydrolase FrmB
MTVILPQNTNNQIGVNNVAKGNIFPVLYLLHGCSDDHTIWTRRTSIERYVSDLGIAVVMPNVHRSFYTDMVYGYKYWTFVSEELPKIVKSFFPVSDCREDTFVAGLSMGGYGAMKLALTHPDRFAAGASLSGVMDITKWADFSAQEYKLIFGDNPVSGTDNDLFFLADKLVKNPSIPRPKIYQCCGTEDFLYQDNVKFKNYFEKLDGFDYTYEEAPGVHSWEFWDKYIQNALKLFFPKD